jgi:type III secretion protein V
MTTNINQRVANIKQDILAGNLNTVLTRFSDILLVACVGAMVGMMIVPLPTWLVDILLSVNITIAVTIMMVSIYISNATQIASYPTILLITTLYRLALDISATRLILLQGDAGDVIRAFGMFVVGGNFVVGAVIFLIITLVQFIVVTKGSERVAEVAARFTLDAMPGKQMSIDADMRSGKIDFQEASKKRDALGRESQFYGAMDGAMKFVKGDAIAGIIITLVNIIGGLIIGIAMRGLTLSDAVQTYSILTIGNGLVAQIPALLISISAGMVVTRVASEVPDSNLGKDVATQILAQPKAIAVAASFLFVLALVPGLPKIPFLILAGLTGSIAYGLFHAIKTKKTSEGSAIANVVDEPELTATIPVTLDVSESLTRFVDTSAPDGKKFLESLVAIRTSLYYEMGVVFPAIQVNGNNPYQAGTYKIWLNEVPAVTGQIRLDSVLVNDSAKRMHVYGLTGEDTTNPATGKPAAWIKREFLERARSVGLQVWDTDEILLMHLTAFLRKHAREFLGIQEVQTMLSTIKSAYPDLVDEVVPKVVPLQRLTEVLQRLVEEQVSIRDLKTILQSLSEGARTDMDIVALTEHVRTGLKRKICYQLSEGRPTLFVHQLDPEIEEAFRSSIRHSAAGPYLSMDPTMTQQVLEAVHSQIGKLPSTAQRPVILTEADIRRFVKRLLDFNYPDVAVLQYEQLTPEISIQPLGYISLVRPKPLSGGPPQELGTGA